MPRRLIPLALLFAACEVPEDRFRGRDSDALLPSVRVRGLLAEAVVEPNAPGERFGTIDSDWEAGCLSSQGDFPYAGGTADYRSTLYFAGWSPRFETHLAPVVVEGSLGLSYCDLDLESAAFTGREGDFGPYFGMAIRWAGLETLQPYVRAASGGGLDGGVTRAEVGCEIRPVGAVGFELAYARHAMWIDSRAGAGDVELASDGLHLGLVLRF